MAVPRNHREVLTKERFWPEGREDFIDVLENFLALPDTEVSRQHAVIRIKENYFTVTDLGSANGTLSQRPAGFTGWYPNRSMKATSYSFHDKK